MLFDLCRLCLQPLRFTAGCFHLLALGFQLGKDILKILVSFVHQIVRFLQNFFRKSEFSGNGKSIRFTRNTNQQLVCGSQRLNIEFTGCIDNAFSPHSIQFQLRIMGRCNNTASHFAAEFNNRSCQGCTFRGICARTQLIEQHQCTVIALCYNIHNCPHMAGEGGQTLRDRLLVTNVCQNCVKGRQFTSITRRNVQTTFCH